MDDAIDYKSLYLLLTDSFDDLPVGEYLPTIERHVLALRDGILPEDHKQELLKQFLPKFVTIVFRRFERFAADLELNKAVQRLFDLIAEAMISLIGADEPIVLDLLTSILSPRHKLYGLQGVERSAFFGYHGLNEQLEFADGKEYHQAAGAVIPIDGLKHIENFGNLAGFEILLSRLQSKEPPTPVSLLKKYLDLFSKVCYFLKADIRERYLISLKDSLLDCFMNLTEEELKQVKKTDIEDLVNVLEDSLRSIMKQDEVHRISEVFCLDFSNKCFKSNLIEKRVNGLVYIADAVDSANTRDEIGDLNAQEIAQFGPRMTKWIRSEWLLRWIKETKLIQMLFDPATTHPELLSNSNRIVSFLAKRNALSSDDLETIWTCASKQHLAHAMFGLLSYVCVDLRPEHTTFFWGKLASLRIEDWTSKHIEFLGRLERQSAARDAAVSQLWKLFQDDNQSKLSNPGLAADAVAKYLEIVTGARMRPQRMETFDHLILYIKESISVAQHIYILKRMIEELPADQAPSKDGLSTRSEIVAHLERRHGLLNILAAEFAEYTDNVARYIAKHAVEDICGTAFFGRLLHREQLSRRLDCLRVMIGAIPAQYRNLTSFKPTIDLIWDKLFEKSKTDEEKKMCFNWFSQMTAIFAEELVHYVFQERLCSPEVSKFCSQKPWAFNTLRAYFIALNTPSKIIEKQGETNFIVSKFDHLMGMGQIWTVLEEAREIAMRGDISDLLVKLHVLLSGGNDIKEIYSRFVSTLMDHLTKAVSTLKKEDCDPTAIAEAENAIDSLIFLMKKFLIVSAEEAKKEVAAAAVAAAIVAQNQAAASSSTQNPGLSAQEKQRIKQVMDFMSCSEGMAWAALERARGVVDTALNLLLDPANEIAFAQEASKYEMKFAKPPAAVAAPVPAPAPVVSSFSAGSLIVDSDEYFKLLFELLDCDRVDKSAVWEIIHQLPRNTHMEKELRDLVVPVDWNRFLDGASAHRLNYSLKIVEHLMKPQDEESRIWCKRFIASGGFYHLYKLFKDMEQDGLRLKDPHFKACLTLLLSIIEFFVRDQIEAGVAPKRSLILSRSSAEQLEKSIDFADFVTALTNLLVNITYIKSHDRSDVKLVEHTMFLLTSTLISRPKLLVPFFAYTNKLAIGGLSKSSVGANIDVETLLLDILMRRPGLLDSVRKCVATELVALCKAHLKDASPESHAELNPATWILLRLLKHVPRADSDRIESTGEHFFWLIENLLPLVAPEEVQLWKELGKDHYNLFVDLYSVIESRPAEESESHEDKILAGNLRVLAALSRSYADIKQKSGARFVGSVLQLCFSSDAAADKVKCRSRHSRTAALALLASLTHGNLGNLLHVIKVISPAHVKPKQLLKTWEPPRLSNKSITGFVGLKNLGSTCYMNSVVQQFYMIPQLRQGLLSVEPPAPEAVSQSEDAAVLSELQRMFSYLQDSDREYFDPKSFADANKLEIGTQQDAEEYFNLVVDKLERALASTSQASLFRDVFGGKTKNDFCCSVNPDHVTKRVEEFLTLNVDIENKSDLSQALSNFFQGETISDYQCAQCHKNVDVVKKISLEALPNTLIVHLKRFRFSIERLEKEKLQHFLQFPMTLNVRQYCSESAAAPEDLDEKFDYHLRGILVHTGNADAGHYYCFIKDVATGQWVRFDDTQVLPFEETDIPMEAFGGQQSMAPNSPSAMNDTEGLQFRNGYMLFYDRAAATGATLTPRSGSTVAPVPAVFKQAIAEDNIEIGRTRMLFDSPYLDFVLQLILQSAEIGSTLSWSEDLLGSALFSVFELGCYFMFETCLRAREAPVFIRFSEVLSALAARCPIGSKWLLYELCNRHSYWLRYALFEFGDETVRNATANLIVAALKSLVQLETSTVQPLPSDSMRTVPISNILFSEGNPSPPGPARAGDEFLDKLPILTVDQLKDISATDIFIDYCFNIMEWTRQAWRRFHNFFGVLRDISMMGHRHRQLMNQRDAIAVLIDYYMGERSPEWMEQKAAHPNAKVERARIADFDKQIYPNLSNFMWALTANVRAVQIDKSAEGSRPETAFSDCAMLEMSDRARKLLSIRDLLFSFVKLGYNVEATSEMFAHISWGSESSSSMILALVIQTIRGNATPNASHAFPVLDRLLSINDDLQLWRVAILFQLRDAGYFTLLRPESSAGDKFDALIEFLCVTMRSKPLVVGWMIQTADIWRNTVISLVTSRLQSLRSQGVPEQRINTFKSYLDLLEKVASNKLPDDVVELWDDKFSLSDYSIQTVPEQTK